MAQLIHTIGEGSAYDADMTLIESFVRNYDDPNNYLEALSVHTYYYSQLLNYWNNFKTELLPRIERKSIGGNKIAVNFALFYENRHKERLQKYNVNNSAFISLHCDEFNNDEECEETYYPIGSSNRFVDLQQLFYKGYFDPKSYYIFSEYPLIEEEFLAQIGSIYPGMEGQFIIRNINKYEERFLNFLNIINKEFEETKNVNLSQIEFLFLYISTLACGIPDTEVIMFRGKSSDTGYPLPNNTGLFGLNTFLYALFSDVKIIGVPSDMAEFDGKYMCPVNFMNHDYEHIADAIGNVSSLRKIYFKILNKDYDKKMKELLVLVLWITMHEAEFVFLKKSRESYFNYVISADAPFVSEFHSEFLSFADIIDDAEVQKLVIHAFPLISKGIPKERYHFTIIMLYGYLELTNLSK